QGEIKEEYSKSHGLYINEASAENEWLNVHFEACLTYQDSIDLVSLRKIRAGEELLTYYGSEYERTWDIWWLDQRKREKMEKLKRKKEDAENISKQHAI